MSGHPIRVTIWNEGIHEKKSEKIRAVYPKGIHAAISEGVTGILGSAITVRTATQDDGPEHGLTDDVLASTDVLTWWGHVGHDNVSDKVVDKVQKRVLEGMGIIVLHSGHYSKIFKRLMGTGCGLKWREANELERIWCVNTGHPIADGFGEFFELQHEEMYGELFDIPQPEELVFVSWFEGGDVFRSGCCWRRGKGKVFYFRPGHESHPTYFDPNVRRVIANAIRWAAPTTGSAYSLAAPNVKVPLSPIAARH